MKRIFIIKENEETGELGLVARDSYGMDPGVGTLIAHDILEHFANDDGSPEHEMMALGASLYVRSGDSWYYQKNSHNSSAAYNISGEMIQQYHYFMRDGKAEWKNPGRTTRIDDIEDILEELKGHTYRSVKGEFTDTEDQDSLFPFTDPTQLNYMIGWMRKGYRKAQQRYKNIRQWKLMQIFDNIARETEQLMRRVEDYMEGLEVVIQVNFQTECVSVSLLEELDY